MVERVIVDPHETVRLKLRTPFAYLQDISDEVRNSREEIEDAPRKTKTDICVGLSEPECSTQVLSCGEDRIRTCGTLPYNRLAGGPNRPLWHLPLIKLLNERRGWDSNPR